MDSENRTPYITPDDIVILREHYFSATMPMPLGNETQPEFIRALPKWVREKEAGLVAIAKALPNLIMELEWSQEAARTWKKRALDVANAPIVVWVVERNFGTATTDDWRYMKYPGAMDDAWTSDWNESLKCFDRAGAEALCVDMPDEWGVRITDHQILSPAGGFSS